MDRFLPYLAGSLLQGAEKSISLVQGGRSQQAAALAWEKGNSGPEENVFSEWLESVKENPVVIDFEVRWENVRGKRGAAVCHQLRLQATQSSFHSFSDDKQNACS